VAVGRPNSIILVFVPPESRPRPARLQNALAIFSLTLIGLSVIAIVIILFVGHAGMTKPTPLQMVVTFFPSLGLPLGALGIIALFVVGALERRKHNTRRAK